MAAWRCSPINHCFAEVHRPGLPQSVVAVLGCCVGLANGLALAPYPREAKMRLTQALLGFAMALSTMIAAHAAPPIPRPFYVVVGDVTQPDGQLAIDVKQLFVDRLRARPDVTLDAPDWLPEEEAAMRIALHNHGMRAYNASLKIESATWSLSSLARNPARGTLTYTARVRVFGYTLPDHELKIGGEGESSGSILVSMANADTARERLAREVIDAAMQEAMAATVAKIGLVAARERAIR